MERAQEDLIRRIASVVGHELRNPLAVINNSAYFVKAKLGAQADPKVSKHLGIIESEISRANRMIADMIAFSRPLELKRAPAQVNALVQDALSAYAFPAGIAVKRNLARANPRAALDAACVGDVLRRLFDNAVEAMNGAGTLTVATSVEGGRVRIAVGDTGPGIAADRREAVLTPFYTTKPRGLGLGLSVALKAVEAHQGRLEVGAGAAGAFVRVALPLVG